MSSDSKAETLSIGRLLSIDGKDVEQALDEHLREAAPKQSFAAQALRLASGEIAGQLQQVLDFDVFELLAQGWVKLRELRSYAEPGKLAPGATAVVNIGNHEITHAESPVVDLEVAGAQLSVLKLTVELTVQFKSVALSIRDAAIRSVAPGECLARVRLKYKRQTLKEESTPKLKLPGRIDLGDGIPLAPTA
jgi:hypothetical protein